MGRAQRERRGARSVVELSKSVGASECKFELSTVGVVGTGVREQDKRTMTGAPSSFTVACGCGDERASTAQVWP